MWFDIAKKSSLFRAALIMRRMYVFPASTFAVKVSAHNLKILIMRNKPDLELNHRLREKIGPLVEQG